jgi:hypothetical protein
VTSDSAPKIDSRTAEEVAREVRDLLKKYLPDWPTERASGVAKTAGVTAALIGIFGRFAEIAIERLNKTPDKNFLAFLDLIGAAPQPPQPARAPITFSLAAGSTGESIVPAGTQVAAPASAGEAEPVIFETERELVVTAARLSSLIVHDPQNDSYADRSMIILAPAADGVPAFQGNGHIEHTLYVGHAALFDSPAIKEVRLRFTGVATGTATPDARTLVWEMWEGTSGRALAVQQDGTNNLTRDGVLVFRNLPPFSEQAVDSKRSRWLRCRLTTPITPASSMQPGRVRAAHLPTVNELTVEVVSGRSEMSAEAAFVNVTPLDLSKDFFPFGETPRFGDTFYLMNAEAFAAAQTSVVLNVRLTNTAKAHAPSNDPEPPIKRTAPSPDLKLRWEYWNGALWMELGTADAAQDVADAATGFSDTTRAFSKSGEVRFKLPAPPKRATIGGRDGFWVRARIVSGNYGRDAYFDEATQKMVAATFAPPALKSVAIRYDLTETDAPEALLTYNDFRYEDVTTSLRTPTQSFAPFKPPRDSIASAEQSRPQLYLGLSLPPNRTTFPNRTLSLYFNVAAVLHASVTSNTTPEVAPRLSWRYWNGRAWAKLFVRDETDALTHSGMVEFLAPPDLAPAQEFGRSAYWLAIRWDEGAYKFAPRLRQVLLNTVMASQNVTIREEILGSSDASANQRFRVTRAPVLHGQQLEVQELELPSRDERAAIEEDEGTDAVTAALDATGRPREIWVRWHEVPDFYGSGPRSRHYTIDHVTGDVRFGDGQSGMIPPRGAGNLRMRLYRSGGGSTGNKPPGTIVQLKTTIPYVDRVTNTEEAAGGTDAESYAALVERAPRMIRHGGRAVTQEDFEDLALLSTPEVARVRCVPLYDLGVPPDEWRRTPGVISLIVVPRSIDTRPLPSLELLQRVRHYLDERRLPEVELVVVGPEYYRVDVSAEVAVSSLQQAGAAVSAVEAELLRFLHPLMGGTGQTGWSFGRQPHESDIYRLLESLPGIDHVNRLNLRIVDDRTGDEVDWESRGVPAAADHFLIYSGVHEISVVYEER